MKKCFLLFTFFNAVFAFAQSTDSTFKRFAIGLEFSPDLSYRYLVSANKMTEFIVKDRNEYEVPKLSFTTGISGVFKLKDKIYLEAGIQYSVKGEKYKRQVYFIAPQSLYDPAIPANDNGSAKMVYNYKDIYIDVPVKLNYYLRTKKCSPFISAGISPNIFLTEKVVINCRSSSGSNFSGYSFINPQALLGFGLDFNLKRIKMRVEPIGRCSVLPVIKNANIKGYFYSVGINYGLYYRFN
ncbi:MAG: outer membrane beta-barrel protein [Bacteroidia bacterium]